MSRFKSEPMHRYRIIKAILISTFMMISPAKGDGTAECNSGSGTFSTECGVNASATANNSAAVGFLAQATATNSTAVGVVAEATATSSTAVGVGAEATASSSTAVGQGADATAISSTAVGQSADATAISSTAVGASAQATATNSTAVGVSADARSEGAVSVGFAAGFDSPVVTDSPQAIAIGKRSRINAAAPGAIAIGGDVNNDSVGAIATAPGAIAIGADTTAGPASTSIGTTSSALGFASVALGNLASASGPLSTALGESSGIDINSTHAIAIGEDAKAVNSTGGIAIGADFNADDTGATVTAADAIALGADAQAIAAGAIAIGANVVADIENTLVTNIPIIAKDPSTTVAPRTMFEIAGAGNTKFNVNNTDANESWAFANPGTGFRLSRQGSGSVEFEVKNNGNVVIAGNLTENSDVNSKQDIQVLDQQAILDKVMALPISQWRYKDDPDSKHIGPMAQDFYQAFELGNTDKGISTLDSSGVALAAIQALKQENVEKNRKITELRIEKDKEIAGLKSEMISIQKELIELKALKQQLTLVMAMTGSAQLTQVKSE